ncbi:MAG: carboxypeptidase-like regulatory domain-containing protein [Cyclobacteriaceae bacterium]
MKNPIPLVLHMAKLFTYVFLGQSLFMGILVANERPLHTKNIEELGINMNFHNIKLERAFSRLEKLSGKTLPDIAAFPITGVVTDENGESLPGATVVIEGTTIGTVTDVDGHFSLEVEERPCWFFLLSVLKPKKSKSVLPLP